jgi:16S rRNA (cytidine1402-2'-O)-methyltransferase
MPGILYVVATPIGHLEDVTLRALRVLREVDRIASEDTRRTAGLLARYDIHTPLVSLHAHNERQRRAALLDALAAGESIAVVSDAGTPLVSDPGADLVRAALDAGITVDVVPGASAVLTALVGSGLSADTFAFLGFAPSRPAERRRWLAALAAEPRTVVFFEAPHRVRDTLADLLETAGDRQVSVARELTKMHETRLRGRVSAVLDLLGTPRGEYTVVVAPAETAVPSPSVLTDEAALVEFESLTGPARMTRRDAVSTLARRYQRPAREVYAAIERGRASRDQ